MPVLGCFFAMACGSVAQQGYSAPPRVGGGSSFDNRGQLSGNQGTTKKAPPGLLAVPEDFSSLTLAPGFLLEMQVYDAPEFSSDLRIDSTGNIDVPMAGSLHVAGLTLSEAAALIAEQLKNKKILNNPQVTLDISQYSGGSISVLGEVHNPGRLQLLAPHSLQDVLALAGGETEYAGNVIEIRRVGNSTQKEVVRYSAQTKESVLSQTMVQPGDVVNLPRAGIVYVLGGVNRPGGYVMQEGGELDVAQAISLAYGTTLNAAVGSMRLIRKQSNGSVTTTQLPFRDIEKGKIPAPKLQAEDIVYVPVSKTRTALTTGLTATAAGAFIYHY
jgi:polysaccharide export outer membrane protein